MPKRSTSRGKKKAKKGGTLILMTPEAVAEFEQGVIGKKENWKKVVKEPRMFAPKLEFKATEEILQAAEQLMINFGDVKSMDLANKIVKIDEKMDTAKSTKDLVKLGKQREAVIKQLKKRWEERYPF